MVQHTELFKRGDFEYLIRTEQIDGHVCGTWYCLSCQRHGVVKSPSDQISDAVDEVKAHLVQTAQKGCSPQGLPGVCACASSVAGACCHLPRAAG